MKNTNTSRGRRGGVRSASTSGRRSGWPPEAQREALAAMPSSSSSVTPVTSSDRVRITRV